MSYNRETTDVDACRPWLYFVYRAPPTENRLSSIRVRGWVLLATSRSKEASICILYRPTLATARI